MATKAPYEQSRAALRRLYGTRKIDASAPQSALDDTPSGRERALRGEGLSRRQVQAEENARFGTLFQPQLGSTPAPPPDGGASTRPLTMLLNRRPPTSTLDSIQQMQSSGAPDALLPSLGTGSYLAGSRPSLMPESPVADASDLSGFAPSSGFTPLSFFKPRPRPSILTGAQNWIAQV